MHFDCRADGYPANIYFFYPICFPVHRTFWCIMSILGFTMVMIGVFVTVCAVPRANRRLYEAGGALFITGGKYTPG